MAKRKLAVMTMLALGLIPGASFAQQDPFPALMRFRALRESRSPQSALKPEEAKGDALAYQHADQIPLSMRRGSVLFLAQASNYALNLPVAHVDKSKLRALARAWTALVYTPLNPREMKQAKAQGLLQHRLTNQFGLRFQALDSLGRLCLRFLAEMPDIKDNCLPVFRNSAQRDWVPEIRLAALIYDLSLEPSLSARKSLLRYFQREDGLLYFVSGKNHLTHKVVGTFIHALNSEGLPAFDFTYVDDHKPVAVGSVDQLEKDYQRDLKDREKIIAALAQPQSSWARRLLKIELADLAEEKSIATEACHFKQEEACAARDEIAKIEEEDQKKQLPMRSLKDLKRQTRALRKHGPFVFYPLPKKVQKSVLKNRSFAENLSARSPLRAQESFIQALDQGLLDRDLLLKPESDKRMIKNHPAPHSTKTISKE